MKKGRSKKHKINKHKERARYYLDNYFWEKEEEVLLKLIAETEIPLLETRDLTWHRINLIEKLIKLKKEDIELNTEIIMTLKEFAEYKIPGEDFQENCGTIFDHGVFKKISVELNNFKK